MEQKIFDDFPKVDCNDCEHYYTNGCDGVSKGKNRACKTFLATRRESIPEEIKGLKNQIKWLNRFVNILGIAFILYVIINLIY